MKRLFFFFSAVIFLLFMTGCWSRRELNELALVVAMAIDKAGDRYLVTVQVVDPGEVASKKGSYGRTPVTTYSAEGSHLMDAVRRMTKITPRKLYFSHLQMFVISEAVAKEGISQPLELLSRDNEFRKDFYVVVTKGVKAKDTLDNLTSLEKIPANKMHSSLKTSEKAWAPTVAIQLHELIADLTSEGKHPVLTGLTIKGDLTKGETMRNVERIEAFARLQYEGIAVFKKDKLIGWLNEEESKGYNYVKNRVSNTVGNFSCPKGGELMLEIIRSKAKVKGKVEQGKPAFAINLNIEANISEVACQIDLTKQQSIEELEQISNRTIEDILRSAINKAQKMKVDIFGFGEIIRRADPEAWKSLKKDWDTQFVNAAVTVHTNFQIRRTGIINKSFLEKVRE